MRTADEIVAEHRESGRLNRAMATQRAQSLWNSFSDNEKTGVRFGMFPAGPMERATAELASELAACDVSPRDAAQLLSVALMECASRDGGMRA